MPDYMKIKSKTIQLPISQRITKDAIKFGVDGYTIHNMHYGDLQSLIMAFQIDYLNQKLYVLRQHQLQKKGISKVEEATEEDFNSL